MKSLHNRVNREELKQRLAQTDGACTTLSFYAYHRIQNPIFFRDYLYTNWDELGVLGRIYVSKEGINAQLSVPTNNWELFKDFTRSITFLKNTRLNIAVDDDGKSFFKLTIKTKNKIVADGLQDETFDVTNKGQHLDAKAFNELTSQPDTIVVDMRNHYESEVGHFENAVLPDVDSFREALPVVEELLADKKDRPIVMYCTGGIRCEKASAYYKHKGFNKVYQLEGGIIKYAQQVEQEGLENRFKGKNFVFDERLGERISEEVISNCHQCGESCDTHINCVNEGCHLLFIQCAACATKFDKCCSKACQEIVHLPVERQKEIRKGIDKGRQVFKKGRFDKLKIDN